jgi:hypothetical protein
VFCLINLGAIMNNRQWLCSKRKLSGAALTAGKFYEIGEDSQFKDDGGLWRHSHNHIWGERGMHYLEEAEQQRLPDAEEEIRDNLKASETQEGGNHYTDLKIQPLELTYLNFGYEGLKAAIYTKINKYMLRKKDNELGQLKKARHCLDILIEKAEEEGMK